MKITIDHVGQFRDAFWHAGRGSQFSYDALTVLFEYLEEIDADYELDVVALCWEYSEATASELLEMYDIPAGSESGDVMAQVLEFLNNETTVLGTTDAGSIVYADF